MELIDCRVLVSATSYGKADFRLKTDLEQAVGEVIYNNSGKPLSSQDLQRLLPGIDGFIAGLDEIDRAAIEAGDSVRTTLRFSVS